MAILRQEAGEFDGAAEILAQMEARFPDEYTCYLQLAYLTLEAEGAKEEGQRDYHMVEAYYNQAVSLAPDGADTPALQALKLQIDQLYAKMQELAEDPLNMGAVQTQYGRFNSAGTILGSLHYNEEVTRYQGETGGFPANLLGALFGIEEVELFA